MAQKVIRVRPDIADKCMLHYNNALCHNALSGTVKYGEK